ncbi:MAG: hypothetical protein D6830_03735 [Ignavibacteria bacterium]|nr:MAG: hypothetical protein D6830_03735 [Ignavibacteria bacterium]
MPITKLFTKKSHLLSSLIKEERKRLCRFNKKDYLKSLFSEIYIPSFKSFVLIFLVVFVLFILSRLSQILTLLHLDKFSFLGLQWVSKESNHYQNLIAIHAGIGAIIFALVIFIAESLRDDEAKDRARVLLRESYLFPLAVAEILIFLIFIWGDISFWSIVPIIAIGLFTICSLSKIIAVLLSKYRFAQKRIELLKERLQQSIDIAIDERIGNNILLSKLNENEIKLEFYPFSIDELSNYYCFNAENFGIISDIDLKALKEIADIIDKEGQQNGFSFAEEEKPEVQIRGSEDTQESKSRILTRNNRRYLMKKFHDIVDEERRALICIDKRLIRDSRKLKELNSLVKSAFIIKPTDNFAEEIRYEISGVKDQFITALNNKQLGKIEELTLLYIKLAEGFLDYITKCGGGYSFEQARKERHSFFAGWDQLRWLSSDIRVIFEKSIQIHDREIIRNVAYLPIAIARRAIDKNDHYVFQEFIGFAELLYIFGIKEKDKDLKDFLIDCSWRYLKEISDIYVEAKLKKDTLKKEELESLRDFGIYFFIIFQNLLKRSFDNRDFDSFEKFKQASQKLFKHFKPSESIQNATDIRWRLEKLELTPERKRELESLLQKQQLLEDIEKNITIRRQQMFFGLASWILNEFIRNKTDENIKQFYQSIHSIFPSKLEEFTDIFLKTHNFDVADFWGWSWWEIKVEGEVQSIQILEKLERFYAIKALSLLADKTEEEINKIELPHNRDLAYLADGTRELMRILDDIKTNPDSWRFVLSNRAISKVDLLKKLLMRAKKAQEQEELQIKRQRKISQKKVQEFKEGVLNGFYESVIIRDIFRYYKLLENRIHEPIKDKKARFGINVVEDKAVFFEGWHVQFGDWGNNYGRNLASGENSYLLDELSKECREISVEEFETTLSKFKKTEDIIILAANIAFWRFFEKSKSFKPKWYKEIKHLKVNGFGGWYEFNGQLIPVFEVYHRKIEKQIFILNKSKLGLLVQLSPLNENKDKKLVKDIFYMNIQAFSENPDLIEQFIKKPPEWLKKIGDGQKQREYLQERVLIHIFERFEYDKLKDFEGYKLILKD